MNPGDIFRVEFAASGGHEQAGRRPAIILQSDAYAANSPLVIVVPLTGATAATRFAGTLTIEPDDTNHLRRTSVALVFQIRAVDRSVIAGRIGAITDSQRATLYAELNQLTGQTAPTNLTAS